MNAIQQIPRLIIDNEQQIQRLPPQCVEAEESLLAKILLNNKYFQEAADILKPVDFYRRSNSLIFWAMGELAKNQEPIDIVTVFEYLKRNNYIQQITGNESASGGAAYLAWLTDYAVRVSHAEYYAKMIHEKARLRDLIKKADEIKEQCYSAEPAPEIIDTAQKEICTINLDQTGKKVTLVSEILPEVIEDIENTQKTGVSGLMTGWKQFDSVSGGLQPGALIMLAGRPGMGKTSFACNLIKNFCEDGKPIGFFSLEMPEKEIAKVRLLPMKTGIDSSRIQTGNLTKQDWGRITNATEDIAEWILPIDDTGKMHYRELNRKARLMKKEYDIQAIFIDQMRFLEGDTSSGKKHLEAASITIACKQLAKELSIPVILLNQLNRECEKRANKRPILSDLREAGEEDTDIVIFCYRDEMYNKDENNPLRGTAEIIFAKHRSGRLATLPFNFHKSIMLFTEAKNYDYGQI